MPDAFSTSALPAWITDAVIADTRTVWEPIYGRPLSDAEVVEILLCAGGLFHALFGSAKSTADRPEAGHGVASQSPSPRKVRGASNHSSEFP